MFRHFVGATTDEEESSISQWKNEKADHLEEYNRIFIFYRDVTAIQSIGKQGKKYDKRAAWNKLNIPRQPQIIQPYYKWVASIVLILSIGVAIILNQQPNQNSVLATHSIISTALKDGSEITLNLESELTYPERFDADERRVSLVGEAYFKIEKDPDRPFIIEVANSEIQVLGTAFNVSQESTQLKVVVDEGLVKMTHEGQEILLEAGTFGVLNTTMGKLIKQDLGTLSAHTYWRTKKLSFNGHTLREVMAMVEEVYQVTAHFENPDLQDCTITVAFENEDIERVLSVIASTLNININKDQKQIFIHGKSSCQE